MEVLNIKDMYRGWFIGDFKPSVYNTDQFEVGYLCHKKGEKAIVHFHEQVLEINLLIKGKIKFNDVIITPGEIFIFKPQEISDPEFLEDCEIICVKTPSLPKDKIIVNTI